MTTSTSSAADPAREPCPSTGRAASLPPDERRAAIVTAAVPLVREYGSSVTTRQIAEAAGIAEGTIFRVFDTKDDVIDAVVARVVDLGETISRIEAIDDHAPLADAVEQCAAILAERLTNVIDVMIAVHKSRAPRPDNSAAANDPSRGPHPGRNPWRNEQHARALEAVTRMFVPYADQLTCSPRRAARVLWLLVFGGTHHMVNDGHPLTPADITDVLLHGIADSSPTDTQDATC